MLTKSSVEAFYSALNYLCVGVCVCVCVCVCVYTSRIFICTQAYHYSGPNIGDAFDS